MTTAPAHPSSVVTLLFGPGEGPLDSLTHAIAASPNMGTTLEKLPQATRDLAAREAAAAAAGLLDVNPVDLLVSGWRQYEDLRSAAHRTLVTPSSSELVELATHRVTVSQEPYVDILVNGQKAGTVRLGLSLDFDLSAVLARVRAGCLAGIHAGRCDITTTLTINDATVAIRHAQLDLPGEITLQHEIRLLPAQDYQQAAGKQAAADDQPWWATGQT